MDPVTHGVVGATLAQCVNTDKKALRSASVVGFASALLADADIFLSSAEDPLFTLEIHRQFTHSLLFIPFGAAIAALLMWWFVKDRLSFKSTYLFSMAGYATAGIMDYVTSYGVLLFWPVLEQRFSMNIIAVFDPFFTAVIIGCTAFVLYSRKKKYAYYALIWIFLYLGSGTIQKYRVIQITQELAAKQDHVIRDLVVKPTIANQVLWSSRYIYEDTLCTYGIRPSLFSEHKVYKGACTELADWQTTYSSLKGSVLYRDIRRFSELSEGYLVRHPEYPEVLGDGRYSMLPTTTDPLWGIEIDTSRNGQHTPFSSYRELSPEDRRTFTNMILGRKSP